MLVTCGIPSFFPLFFKVVQGSEPLPAQRKVCWLLTVLVVGAKVNAV